MKQTLLKLIPCGGIWAIGDYACHLAQDNAVTTVVKNQLAVSTVNGGNTEFIAQHATNYFLANSPMIWTIVMAIVMILVLRKDIFKLNSKCVPLLLASILFLPSCRRPYQEPRYSEVKNNETAFVIPLEGDSREQAKLNSAEFYEAHKVTAKRIQTPTRWNQTGRHDWEGEWINSVKVIVVDRSPVTRNWQSGTSGSSKEDQAIWVESSDSVGFSMGFNCTAFIKEEDTASFLYWYSSGSLANVMDTEIRGRVQQVAAEEAAKLPLDQLRDKKNEIALKVREDIVPFFQKRGITITTVGMFGGMTYENKEIQQSIDKVFVAQQAKNIALANYDAQKKENERIVLAAQGKSTERQIQVEAEAKARTTQAIAEADAIKALTKAVSEGGSNYLQLKTLEVQTKQAERWNGQLPTIIGGVAPFIDTAKFLNK